MQVVREDEAIRGQPQVQQTFLIQTVLFRQSPMNALQAATASVQ